MVAGGTGITPMWQVANHILSDGFADKTQVHTDAWDMTTPLQFAIQWIP